MSEASPPKVIPVARADRWRFLSELIQLWHSRQPANSGYLPDDIAACEKRLGLDLPTALKEWYLSFGRRFDIWNPQDKFLPPEEISIESRILIFYVENQAVTFWGIRIADLPQDDPPVFTRDFDGRWRTACPELSLFAIQMFFYTSQFTARHRIYGSAPLDSINQITSQLPRLPLPPFLLPGGEFRFHGFRDLIAIVGDTGHLSAKATCPSILSEFHTLIVGTDFEILHECNEARRVLSPDGQYIVQFGDLDEFAMGAPMVGPIRILKLRPRHSLLSAFFGPPKPELILDLGDQLFGETVLFSPDSQLVALEQQIQARPPRTQLIVIELSRPKIHFIPAPTSGTTLPVNWETNTRLNFRLFCFPYPGEQSTWQLPSKA